MEETTPTVVETPKPEETTPTVVETIVDVKESEKNSPFKPNIKGFNHPAFNTETSPYSVEDKISNFLENKRGIIKLNPFLKTLFPVKPNPQASIGDSRYLSGILDKMQSDGKFRVVNDSHKRLGSTYYPENNDNKSKQYNLDTLNIEVEQ